MSFDFATYLADLDPRHRYSVYRLTGGATNVTVRATKRSPTVHGGRFPGLTSIVLKYAPPYVAAVGPEATMTRSRQVIEARALSLFKSDLWFHTIQDESSVSVPELLFHDTTNHVLAMKDLGDLPSLSDIFIGLGGYMPGQCGHQSDTGFSLLNDMSLHEQHLYHSTIGSRLGSFFAHLHSKRTRRSIVSSPNYGARAFHDSHIHQAVHDYAIKSLGPHLEVFADLISTRNTPESLFERLETDFLRPTPIAEQSFILGDCWPGAVLISPLHWGLSSQKSKSGHTLLDYLSSEAVHIDGHTDCTGLVTAVIDFEFASVTRGPHGDVAQLMAHLELFLHAARFHRSKHHAIALETLIHTLIDRYKDMAKVIAAMDNDPIVWLKTVAQSASIPAQMPQAECSCPDPNSVQAQIVRSALLALAGEMVNCAFWKVWPCRMADCGATLTSPSSSLRSLPSPKLSPSESEHCGISRGVHPLQTPSKRRPSFQTYASSSGSTGSPRPMSLRPSLSPLSSNKSSPRSIYRSEPETWGLDDHTHAQTISPEQGVSKENSVRASPGEFKEHHPDTVHDCRLIRSMASNAIWLMEHAGKDTEEMCEERNWRELWNYEPGIAYTMDGHRDGEAAPAGLGDFVKRRTWLIDLFFDIV